MDSKNAKARHTRSILVNSIGGSFLMPVRYRTALMNRAGMVVHPTAGVRARFVCLLAEVRIGARTFINVNCTVDGRGLVDIGDRVAIGISCKLLTSTHVVGSADRRAGELEDSTIRICDGAWLGADVTVMGGVTIGEGAVVGTGSLVTEDVAPNTVVFGRPARPHRVLD